MYTGLTKIVIILFVMAVPLINKKDNESTNEKKSRRKRKKIKNTDDVAGLLRDDFQSKTKIQFEGDDDYSS